MVFTNPTWFEGMLVMAGYFLIPLILGIILLAVCFIKDKPIIGTTLFSVCFIVAMFGSWYLWWDNYEVPSVQSKVVTVDNWQPKAGIHTNDKGMMIIDNADQLMLITSDGEGFLNEENFLFQKFDTRDILNTMKPGGTYNISYYGWREGFNSGFPNILSVEKVVDESNATNVSVGDYFGTKLV